MGKRAEKPRGCGLVLGLSLAVGLVLCAPAPTVTSSLAVKDTAAGDAGRILEDATTVSAVQDWSLLCEELCGAGLGVLPVWPKDTILRPEVGVAKCRQLCELPKDEWGDRVCSSFCRQRRRSLSGCSPCQQAVHGVQEAKESDSDAESEMRTASGVQGEAAAHGSGSAEEASPKAIVGVVAAADSTTDTTTASPDWNELCKALCKTGDGGSLCNCDLSPFFS
ncbi:hypothetical protein KR018_009878 [Drosophila ironensis]|nr:hypothetical protein KR018_009878 [Drosophila ironensis]